MVRRRGPGGSSQERAEGRVRDRVRGRTKRGEGRSGRNRGTFELRAGRSRGTFDVRDIEGYANRLRDHVGDTRRRGEAASSLGGTASNLEEAASGLVGAASGLAGGSFADRFRGTDAEGSEDFMTEVRERLGLIEERLGHLEDQMRSLLEGEVTGNPEETGGEPDPYGDQ